MPNNRDLYPAQQPTGCTAICVQLGVHCKKDVVGKRLCGVARSMRCRKATAPLRRCSVIVVIVMAVRVPARSIDCRPGGLH